MPASMRDHIPSDKPQNMFETLIVGALIVGVLLVIGIVSAIIGGLLATLAYLFQLIGLFLIGGMILSTVGIVFAGYTWIHIDPQHPFSWRDVYHSVSVRVSTKLRDIFVAGRNVAVNLGEGIRDAVVGGIKQGYVYYADNRSWKTGTDDT